MKINPKHYAEFIANVCPLISIIGELSNCNTLRFVGLRAAYILFTRRRVHRVERKRVSMSRECRDVLLLSFTYFTRINIDCNRHRHEHNETRKRNKQTVRTQTNENVAQFFFLWHSVILLRRRYNFPRVVS